MALLKEGLVFLGVMYEWREAGFGLDFLGGLLLSEKIQHTLQS